jgi:transcriptional regulator with XRE-family HTH domain
MDSRILQHQDESMTNKFSIILKEWRQIRNFSQLDLSLAANVSARHISFLENGRAQPSRKMALNLAEKLDMPRRSRNALLQAAGFAPVYYARSLDDAEMSMVKDAINWMLLRHDPYPAVMLDRRWQVLKMNRCASFLMATLGIGVGDSVLKLADDADKFKSIIENWQDVAHHMAARLRLEAHHWGDDYLLEYAKKLETDFVLSKPKRTGALPPFMPTNYKHESLRLSFFSTFSQFSSAEDIALADLKIEHMFPADEETRKILHNMAS